MEGVITKSKTNDAWEIAVYNDCNLLFSKTGTPRMIIIEYMADGSLDNYLQVYNTINRFASSQRRNKN